ncbi:fasciclin domain-containing protein [Gramella sp. AN32]|uniref:Fasciclin domain-containing protein n=1 Tax=Christiangramia antarctica TaxID=2058158 RepID=A0ABW5X336_9FLAO|nr:fasciclin domain-containing protein [Gramella sp. AN32]
MKFVMKLFGLLCILAVWGAVQSCSDSLEDHVKVNNSNLKATIGEKISQDSDLSSFYQLLQETGYDEILNSSKTFTIWAPNNAAMSMVESELLTDLDKKIEFVKNHITLASTTTGSVEDTLQVQMLTGKYQSFYANQKIENANIIVVDQYASNGIYHVIDAPLTPKLNLWEFIVENTDYDQNKFITKLNDYDLFGEEERFFEIYEGMELDKDTILNEILRTGYYLKDEKKKFTYFLIQNDGYDQEVQKLKPYTKSLTPNTRARYYVSRDLIFEGYYNRDNLPDTLISQFGVKVPINTMNIVGEPVKLSNGIVYVMNQVNVKLEDKLQPIKIEGEEPTGFSQDDKRAFTFYREKTDPSGEYFRDIEIYGHGVPEFEIKYRAPQLYSTTYKVYWRAVNDFEGSFWQHLRIGGGTYISENGTVTQIDPIKEFGDQEVVPFNYDEVYLGEFTLEEAGDVDLALVAANTGTSRWNALTLDYLVLVPIIE